MRRTSVTDLLAPFLVVGLLSYLLLRRYYDSLPNLQFAVAVPIVALAVVESIAARRVRAAIMHRPDARPMTALAIARALALAKASALVAAGLLGALAGLLLRVLPDFGDVDAARHDTYVGIAWLLSAGLLLAAALILERAAVDPGHGRRSS